MSSLRALERYARRARARPGLRCELCAAPLGDEHPHVVDVEERRLLCACRACGLALGESSGGRYRRLPSAVRTAGKLGLSDEAWRAIGIPMGLAFVFRSSRTGAWTALLPSPAGAVEAELPQHAWARALDSLPSLAALAEDVEGLLLRRQRDGSFDAFTVPIDHCYRLIGIVRRLWRGFDGGDQARAEVDRFFAELREKTEEQP